MKNIANADRPKSVGAMLPPRPLRRSGKVAQTACNSDRREGKSCIPTLNQTFADSRILKISKFPTFRIADVSRVDGLVGRAVHGLRDFIACFERPKARIRLGSSKINVGAARSRFRSARERNVDRRKRHETARLLRPVDPPLN